MAALNAIRKGFLPITLLFAWCAGVSNVHASTFKVLYSFKGTNDGGEPDNANLIIDGKGNLYGTGALPYAGMVFELTTNGTEAILFKFPAGRRGGYPESLTGDREGNLRGVTCCGGVDNGVIFEITSKRRERLIHTFQGSPSDGCTADDSMVSDKKGNYYGTTFGCGKYGYGSVFRLAAHHEETLTYSFMGGQDGLYPFAGLILGSTGNLYGVTDYGGKLNACSQGFGGCGTVFRLTPGGSKSLLHAFNGSPSDGYLPTGSLLMDESGNLYGTTQGGGVASCVRELGCGIVFKLAPDGTETVLHLFAGGKGDGSNPIAGLVADSAGNLYGTTQFGGSSTYCNGAEGCGTIYEISMAGTETILHKFNSATDGANPDARLIHDKAGNLYGTASTGGKYGYGTVFEITP